MHFPRLVGAALVGATLVGAALVACAAPPAVRHDPPPRLNYVAMGDSIASAPGVPDLAPPAGCKRSTNNYPSVLARRLSTTTFVDVTCSGATTLDLARREQQTKTGAVARQLDALSPSTDLITVTIGANDIDLVGDVEGCVVKAVNPPPCIDKFVVGAVDRISARINEYVPVWSVLIDEVRGKA